MFQGPSEINLDIKGRLALPMRYRESLISMGQGALVVTAHPHRCLLLYPKFSWEPIRQAVMSKSSLDVQTGLLQGLLVGYADDVVMDGQGRVLLAPALRRFAGIDRQVMMFGQGNHFKLWSPDNWDKQFAQIEQLGQQLLPTSLQDLVL